MLASRRLIAIFAAVVFGSAGVVNAAPITDVVFGNLGSSGTNAIDDGSTAQVGSTTAGLSGNKYATAFTTGPSAQYRVVQGVSLGLGDIEPFSTAILSIVADSGGTPTGSTLATQSLQVGSNGLYTFGLGNLFLSTSTQYWVTLEVQDPTAPSYFTWLRNAEFPAVAPTGQNGSGYTFPSGGAMRSQNDGAWAAYAQGASLSISIMAVPEPSTVVLGVAGLGVAGLLRFRRRKAAT